MLITHPHLTEHEPPSTDSDTPERRDIAATSATTGSRPPPRRVEPDVAIRALAETLGVEPAALKAVWAVESAGASFRPDGKPAILFERHIFWRRLVAHKIDPRPHALREPTLLATTPGGYGSSASQHERLRRAELIHRAAARESASWGAFQIMGFHWRALRYASIDVFVEAMFRDEAAHFDALGRFLSLDPRLLRALRALNWPDFARAYNGPAYGKNRYDEKLANAYRECKAKDGRPSRAEYRTA